jgi:DNA-binding LytR/AlgR family response regulator
MKKHRILIVDDRIFEAETDLAVPLRKLENVEVMEIVSNYKDAIAVIENNPPSLAICDVQLKTDDFSNADGIKIAQRLAELGIPYFLVTAYPDSYFETHILPFRPLHYLQKPIRSDYLVNMVKLALKGLDESEEKLRQNQLVFNVANDWFAIRANKEVLIVPVKDVAYFTSASGGNYAWVVLKNSVAITSKEIHLSLSLGDIKDIVEPIVQKIAPQTLNKLADQKRFLRVSRSLIINVELVERYWPDRRFSLRDVLITESNQNLFQVDKKYWAAFVKRMRGI